MVFTGKLTDQHDQENNQFGGQEHPDLSGPVVEHQGVDGSLEEGPDSIEEDHQFVGRREPEHVDQEVPSQLAILLVVPEVAGEGSQRHQEEHHDHEHLQQFGECIEAIGREAVPQGQESEQLDIVLDE